MISTSVVSGRVRAVDIATEGGIHESRFRSYVRAHEVFVLEEKEGN